MPKYAQREGASIAARRFCSNIKVSYCRLPVKAAYIGRLSFLLEVAMKRKLVQIFFLIVFAVSGSIRLLKAETRISIGVTETMETFNPYGDSVSLMYSVWCMVLGCLARTTSTKVSTWVCWWKDGKSKTPKTGTFIYARIL